MVNKVSSSTPVATIQPSHDSCSQKFSLRAKDSIDNASSGCWQTVTNFISSIWNAISSFFCCKKGGENLTESKKIADSDEDLDISSSDQDDPIDSTGKVWEFRFKGLVDITKVIGTVSKVPELMITCLPGEASYNLFIKFKSIDKNKYPGFELYQQESNPDQFCLYKDNFESTTHAELLDVLKDVLGTDSDAKPYTFILN